MAIGPHITITPELAIAVGELAREHKDCGLTIAYDDERPEQEWLVQFDAGYGQVTYVVNDETGESSLAGLGEGRQIVEYKRPDPGWAGRTSSYGIGMGE